MNFRFWLRCFAIQILIGASALTLAQQGDEEGARGKFITTRPKTPRVRPPAKDSSSTSGKLTTSEPVASIDGGQPNQAIALQMGYTLYQRAANGSAVRVDPTKDFHEDDAVRLVVEPNIDGYLYVFTTEDNSKATMIFPDGRLNRGENRVLAHVPYEVPSSLEEREDYRWFKFDKQPAVERLYLVFARRPLPDVKTGEDLVAYCRSQMKRDCAWAPPGTFWDQIIADAKTSKFHSTKRSEGQVLSESEREASSRHIGLSQGDPEPWLVVTNPDAASHSLTMMVSLTHK